MQRGWDLTFPLVFDKASNAMLLSKKLQDWTNLRVFDFEIRERERLKCEK